MTSTEITNSLLVEICRRHEGSVVYRHNVIRAKVKLGDGFRWIRSSPDGVSDIVGVHAPSGRMLAIEVKAGRDRIRPEQKSFLEAVVRAGGIAIVARDVDAALAELEREIGRRKRG